MTAGSEVALVAPGSAASAGAPASPNTQLPLPSAFVSSKTATSVRSNERTSTGPETSDQSPTCADTRPISTICGCEPQCALPRRTRSATREIEGSTSSSNAPSIANGRPRSSVARVSMRPLCRPRSPKAR